MQAHTVVSNQEWLAQRRQLLEKEKEFTRLRDQLSAERRALPWRRVERDYTFDGSDGARTLAELFEGCSQLVIYHFMFAPDWEAGCKSCSFWAEHFDSIRQHLPRRDANLVAVSRAPLALLRSYQKRMNWQFPWYSSHDSSFNFDFNVSFTPQQLEGKTVPYNYGEHANFGAEMPGISVFIEDDGEVFHTYSCYARGLDMLNGTYQFLDIVPKGRDEAAGPMAWLRRHDEYQD